MAGENHPHHRTEMGGTHSTLTIHRHTKCTFPPSATQNVSHCLCSFLAIFLLLAGATALTVWLIYRPSRPDFKVVSAAIYTMNTTSPHTISTTMLFTLLLHNPNKRTAVFYDRLSASVSYRNQAIALPVLLHELFLEPESEVTMSPMVGGGCVPVSQEVVDGLVVDQEYGVVGLRVELQGRLRWKAGPFWGAHRRMYVKCDVLVGVREGVAGQAPLLASPACLIDDA